MENTQLPPSDEENFERMAKRLDYLWMKESLSEEEEKEAELILNNAMVAEEIMKGNRPEEFRQ